MQPNKSELIIMVFGNGLLMAFFLYLINTGV